MVCIKVKCIILANMTIYATPIQTKEHHYLYQKHKKKYFPQMWQSSYQSFDSLMLHEEKKKEEHPDVQICISLNKQHWNSETLLFYN